MVFLALFGALIAAIHYPYFKLPFHWDELGQFVPAALDLYRHGDWVPRSTLPNVHPPAVMALVALAWQVFGYATPEHSIVVARATMLAVASLGALFSFLLAIRLARGTAGAPAFAAILFLLASPLFYTQSMMVQLDMPAMTLTILALLLFLDGRWGWCAAACTLLVLTKETAITTPLVFGVWLGWREKKRREALYFLAPAVGLAAWLVALHRATGHWLGNAEFAQYNVADALKPLQILYSVLERALYLFFKEGRFIGAIALYVGWRLLRGRDWAIDGAGCGRTVGGGHFTGRSGAGSLPSAGSADPIRCVRHGFLRLSALLAMDFSYGADRGFAAGLGLESAVSFSIRGSLAMVDFVNLQRSAAESLEFNAPARRIASMWPFTGAIAHRRVWLRRATATRGRH